MPTTNALANPPTLDDLPATPDRADRTSFAVRCTALFDHLKNTSVAQWRTALSWMNAAASAAAQSVQDAAGQASLSGQRADAAAASASAAANTLAAAQAALGAVKWVPGAYASGACAWSPINGQLYRTRAAIANSTVDPINDPTNWFSLGLMSLPIQQVTNTGGSFYGAANGGLNTINEITLAGACAKYLPQNPANGDVCVVVVTNGRADNSLVVNPNNPIPLQIGAAMVTDSLVLGIPPGAITFKFFSSSNVWRYM